MSLDQSEKVKEAYKMFLMQNDAQLNYGNETKN